MLTSTITVLVGACCRFAAPVAIVFLMLFAGSAQYIRSHFAINTDSSQLISTKLAWRQREQALDKAFPQRTDLIVVVVDGANPDLADRAAQALAHELTRYH